MWLRQVVEHLVKWATTAFKGSPVKNVTFCFIIAGKEWLCLPFAEALEVVKKQVNLLCNSSGE